MPSASRLARSSFRRTVAKTRQPSAFSVRAQWAPIPEEQPVTMMLGGERKTIMPEGEPRYKAVYELESPDVLLSAAWAKLVEEGRWPGQVRPFTKNRRHVILERI